MSSHKSENDEPTALVRKRQAENESVFREANEKVQADLENFTTLAYSEGQADLAPTQDMVLNFCCECSDENCRERIPMSIGEYSRLHQDRHNFIISPNHETPAIEFPVAKRKRFWLVRKFVSPSEKNATLRSTPTDNV